MNYRKRGLGLSAALAWGVGVSSAATQQLNPQQQIQVIEQTAMSICTTVKKAKGQQSHSQIEGDVHAQLGGIVGKVVDVGVSGEGGITRDEFEGLSREATATALEGDRGCRERVFIKMFDKFTAADQNTGTNVPKLPHDVPIKKGLSCIVSDPTPTKLNVRASPNGLKKGTLSNGYKVQILRSATADNGKSWVYVSTTDDRDIGWVFLPYLTCM